MLLLSYSYTAWISEDNPFHQYDMRVRPGKGPGWNLFAVLAEDYEWPILFHDNPTNPEVTNPVGYMRDTTKRGKSSTGKENTESFLEHAEKAFKAMKDHSDGKICVLIIAMELEPTAQWRLDLGNQQR